jgi:hypothetical protein
MPNKFKVWIEIEEYNPTKDIYEKGCDPLDLKCSSEREAIRLQTALHSIGEDILSHFGKPKTIE